MRKEEGFKIIQIRVQDELHKKFKSKAAANGKSMQEEIEMFVAGYV